ncbi:MAG: tetratricopeptide repeat protein [Terracidiphilus sp.]
MKFILQAGFLLLAAVLAAQGQASSVYEQGRAAFDARQYADAAMLFERAEASDPGHPDALLFEGKALANIGRFSEADEVLHRFLVRSPDVADAHYMLGFVLHRENHPQDSLAEYTTAARFSPPQSDDLKIVALDYVLLNDYPDAIHWLERAVAIDPQNREAWYGLGRCYYTQSRFTESEQAFQHVLALKPEDVKTVTNLGLVYEMENRIDDADRTYGKAVALARTNPRSDEWPYLNYASFLLENSRAPEAIPLLEQAIGIAPRCADCHGKLGRALAATGKPTDAIGELREAVAISPQDPKMHYELGRAYRAAGQMDLAKEELALSAKLYGARATDGVR